MICGIECVLGKLPDASYVPEENIPMDLEHPVDGRMWLSILFRNVTSESTRPGFKYKFTMNFLLQSTQNIIDPPGME